jgi:hypothetical protein
VSEQSNDSPPEELSFVDLEPTKIPVNIGNVRYWLVEADEGAAVQYRDAGIAAARFDDGNLVGVRGIADVQSLLVSLCLFRAIDVTPENPRGRVPLDKVGNFDKAALVPRQMVRQWKPVVVKSLFDTAKKISRLEESESVESIDKQIAGLQKRREKLLAASAKNSPGATGDTSA